MGEFVLFFDLEADSGSRADDFKWTQVTCACATMISVDACIKATGDPEAAERAVANGTHRHWWRDVAELGQDPLEEMLRLMDMAVLIVAFNGLEYDFPLMKRHYCRNFKRYVAHRTKTLDPFMNIKLATGKWYKLDRLLIANGLPAKIANGKEAITMWEQDRREELREYCAADVFLMARLCLQSEIVLPDCGRAENRLFGVASALAACEASRKLNPTPTPRHSIPTPTPIPNPNPNQDLNLKRKMNNSPPEATPPDVVEPFVIVDA